MSREKKQIEPSPFAGREFDQKKLSHISNFSKWYNSMYLNKKDEDIKNRPTFDINEIQTKTIKYFVVYIKPKQEINFYVNNNEDICFWQKTYHVISEQPEELNAQIKNQFSSIILPTFIMPIINQHLQLSLQQLKQVRIRKNTQRIVYHYISNKNDCVSNEGMQFPNNPALPLYELIEASGEASLFVFDCDKAGLLLSPFMETYNFKKNQTNSKSLNSVAFFSCSSGETMPRTSDYPLDFFTSCLTSPARIALIWHSRNYYCFQNGSLQPLSLLFLEEMDADDITNEKHRIKLLLDELTSVIRSTVEAIALRSLDPQLFLKLFRTDHVLSELTTNFILACRILSFFDIHPISFPNLPCMSQCKEWHTLDLRLDATLYLMKHNEPESPLYQQLTYHRFLEDILVSFQNIVNAKCVLEDLHSSNFKQENLSIIAPPFELSFMPLILNDSDLCDSACQVLAQFLDSSLSSVILSLFYPIPKVLFTILIKNRTPLNKLEINSPYQNPNLSLSMNSISTYESTINSLLSPNKISSNYNLYNVSTPNPKVNSKEYISENLIFCLIKILALHQAAKNSLIGLNQSLIEKVLMIALNEKSRFSHLIVILIALLLKDSTPIFRQIITDPSIFTQLDLENFKGDSRIWVLYIISGAITSIKDYLLIGRLLEPICQLCKNAPHELHAPLIYTLSCFIKTNPTMPSLINKDSIKKSKKIEFKAAEAAFEFYQSSSSYVRHELLLFAKKYINSNNSKFSVEINQMKPLYKKIILFVKDCENDPDKKVRNACSSVFFEIYISALLKPIRKLLSGNFSFEEVFSRSQPNNFSNHKRSDSIRRKSSVRPIEQKTLKLNSSYHHKFKITSELEYVNDLKYIFGDKNGNINIKSFDTLNNITNSLSLTPDKSITEIKYTYNQSDPLLFACNSDNNCYVIKVDQDFSLSQIDSFLLYGDNRLRIDKKKGMLISYNFNKGNEFHIRDMKIDRFIRSITPKSGPTKDIQFLSYFDDVIALCSSGFECYDLRVSSTEPIVFLCDEFESPPFRLSTLDETIPIFAVALECHSLCKIDMRHPEGMKTSKIFCNCDSDHQMTHGFAIHPKSMTGALSTEHGVTCVNFNNYMQENVMPNTRYGMRIEKPSSILFHPDEFSLVFVNNNDLICSAI